MLRLIQTEFLKLRRRKLIWMMLSSALVMPILAFLYFRYLGETGVEPAKFYKWSALGYTPWVILPVVLGTLCTMLLYDEKQYDILKQLWIVPVSKMGYFFSKFFVVFVYSVGFMLVTFAASVLSSVLSGCVIFEWDSILYLLEKCLEIGVMISFAMLPILAVAASQKGYVFPVCVTLVYTLFGLMLMTVNMYLHPLSSIAAIINRNGDIPGIALHQAITLPSAFLCICVWDIAAVLLVKFTLGRKM